MFNKYYVLSFGCAKKSFDKLRIKSTKKTAPAMIPIAIGDSHCWTL